MSIAIADSLSLNTAFNMVLFGDSWKKLLLGGYQNECEGSTTR